MELENTFSEIKPLATFSDIGKVLGVFSGDFPDYLILKLSAAYKSHGYQPENNQTENGDGNSDYGVTLASDL